MKQRYLFIDRDGTIIEEPSDEQIDDFGKLKFVPGVIRNLSFISRKLDFKFVMVTNQDGLGTPSFPEDTFWPVHNFVIQTLKGEGIEFAEQLIDRHFPEDNSPMRKPGTGMLKHYIDNPYCDMANSYVIGDRESDRQLADNLGCKALILGENGLTWDGIADRLFAGERIAEVRRTTKETDVYVKLNLDGSGKTDISTGLGFFDHMLDQLGHHGMMDVTIHTKGDLRRRASHHRGYGHCLGRVSLSGPGRQARHRALWLLPGPWMTVCARWLSTSADGPGWCGMPTSAASV